MNLYPNFSEQEYALLGIGCTEEIKYWKRMNLSSFTVTKDLNRLEPEDQDRARTSFFNKYPGLKEEISEKKEQNIERFKALGQKLHNKDVEYCTEDIHWLKIMCQETIPQLKRHVAAKLQIDGTASLKHAHLAVRIALEGIVNEYVKDYTNLAERLSKMDTIPGDGLNEAVGFRFKP